MNWISGSLFTVFLIACAACGAPTSEANADDRVYDLNYRVKLDPAEGIAEVVLQVAQNRELLRELTFEIDARVSDVGGSGEVDKRDGQIAWRPTGDESKLQWTVVVDNKRSNSGYDALMTADFAVFRAEDIIPRAATRTLKDAHSRTTLSFDLPAGWSVITEYSGLKEPIEITRPGRRFSQPTGWIAAGKLGIRRDTLAGTRVAIAGPQGHNVRRMDMMALLNWTLPELKNLLGDTPERLTIVSADDPMWRGGLSAPNSLFLHADRPLISENATSTLLHELMHVALGITSETGYDWIVEGIAEYYSLELLHRSGAITSRRHARAREDQLEWSADAPHLCGRVSSGATTALAAVTFRQLDREISAATDGLSSLDNLVTSLSTSDQAVTLERLQSAAASLLGAESSVLETDRLLGCAELANN